MWIRIKYFAIWLTTAIVCAEYMGDITGSIWIDFATYGAVLFLLNKSCDDAIQYELDQAEGKVRTRREDPRSGGRFETVEYGPLPASPVYIRKRKAYTYGGE